MTIVDVFQDVLVAEVWKVLEEEENTMNIFFEFFVFLLVSVMHSDLLNGHYLKLCSEYQHLFLSLETKIFVCRFLFRMSDLKRVLIEDCLV